jgi:hypothetical protein
MDLAWYCRRLRRMEVAEAIWRVHDVALKQLWRIRSRKARSGACRPPRLVGRAFVGALGTVDRGTLPPAAVDRLVNTAQGVIAGRWRVFGRPHPAFGAHPDWFLDARSSRKAPSNCYAFDIRYRDEGSTGNIKYIWEPSRHQHLTMMAAAYAVTGESCYADRVAIHLTSWWSENPFLSGPHWISGVELGVRLISWVWVRRLLAAWPKAAALFEDNPQFLDQLYHHQHWLAAFRSRGSSANNHLVAEAAGLFAASCAFPLFAQSERWRRRCAQILEREIVAQNFASGLNREQATEYHGFVAELFLAAAIEGELSGQAFRPIVWERIRAMIDALAAVIDARGEPPRQGDSDNGVALLTDDPEYDRWKALLSTGKKLFGPQPWWPEFDDEDVRTPLWTRGILLPPTAGTRPSARPHLFGDAGQAFLRAGTGSDEIWCRCDHGPHGFGSIAAHAHADALSVEVRIGGIEILADPGTYCYHGDPEWRSYFRSTVGHNTVELMGRDQSVSGGPFLWTKQAQAKVVCVDGLEEVSPQALWVAEHTGYVTRDGPVHRRTVTLNRAARALTIQDEMIGGSGEPVPARVAFHFGPEVDCRLLAGAACLSWQGGKAELELPADLSWTLHRGEETPPFGWISPSFDVKVPAFSLLGTGAARVGSPLTSRLLVGKAALCPPGGSGQNGGPTDEEPSVAPVAYGEMFAYHKQ